MNEMMTVLAMAVTVEALVEYGKSIGVALCGSWKRAVIQLAAVAAGIGLCLLARADLFAVLGLGFSCPWAGCALTGVLVSRGANYVSELAGRLAGSREVP